MMTMLKKLWKDEEGPTAVEYALMLALIALVVAAAVPGISDAVQAVFTATAGAIAVPGGG